MAASVTFTVEFDLISCGECGIHFAVPKKWLADKRSDHTDWHCPNGHVRLFRDKSQLEIANEERLKAQADANEARHLVAVAEKKSSEAVAELERIKTRVHRGVCPCCNRSFVNLQRHMVTKHPDRVLPAAKPKLLVAG